MSFNNTTLNVEDNFDDKDISSVEYDSNGYVYDDVIVYDGAIKIQFRDMPTSSSSFNDVTQ